MKNKRIRKIIYLIFLWIMFSSVTSTSSAQTGSILSSKYCLSPGLILNNPDLQVVFESQKSNRLVSNSNNPIVSQGQAIIVGNTSIIFNGREIGFFELTASLKLLLNNQRFTHFARNEKATVKYAPLSAVELLLISLANSELAEYAEQINIIIAILHLAPDQAAIVLNGIDPLQQKSISNLTDKNWTNAFRMKRFDISMGKDLILSQAWYNKVLQTYGQERKWWYDMSRLAMPISMSKSLNADLQKNNLKLLDQSI